MHVLLSIAFSFLIGELLSILAFENESLLVSAIKKVLQISTDDVMNGKHIISQPIYHDPTRSYVEDLCSHFPGPSRLACCKPQAIKYLYNVQFDNGKLVLFAGSTSQSFRNITLPDIVSIVKRKVVNYNLKIERRQRDFDPKRCKIFINGTLHVFGRSTTNNLFHTFNDNLLPLASQLILDSYMAPEYLTLYRAQLTGHLPPENEPPVSHMALMKDLVPNTLKTETFQSRGSAAGRPNPLLPSGVCVRRVVWGGGTRLIYNHLLIKLRQESVALLREVVKTKYISTVFPPAYLKQIVSGGITTNRNNNHTNSGGGSLYQTYMQHTRGSSGDVTNSEATSNNNNNIEINCKPFSSYSHIKTTNRNVGSGLMIKRCDFITQQIKTQNKQQTSQQNTPKSQQVREPLYRPLNIILYTRGDSSNGRSMKNETLIITSLNKMGAHATLCCNFKQMTLNEQINYAYHADVIIGLHGAGLMNAVLARPGIIVIELKTLYGYRADLFAVVTSSIPRGVHIQINVAGYATKGGSRSIDTPLVERVVYALQTALYTVSENEVRGVTEGSVVELLKSHKGDIIIYPPIPMIISEVTTSDTPINININTTSLTHNNEHKTSNTTTINTPILTPSTTNTESSHILGPFQSRVKIECTTSLSQLHTYWILIDAEVTQYCRACDNRS